MLFVVVYRAGTADVPAEQFRGILWFILGKISQMSSLHWLKSQRQLASFSTALKRDCYQERAKSQFLPKVRELTKSSIFAGLELVLWRSLARKKSLLVPVCFSHLQQFPPVCRLAAALLCLSVLVRSFLMWATATRSNSCCFRSVITGAFGFWTGGKVAAAAAGRSADQR